MSALWRKPLLRSCKLNSTSTSLVFNNFLINMYDKCGSFVDACKVFNQMTQPNVSSWNVIISAHRRRGFPQRALALFSEMQSRAIQPDHFTISAILPVCAELASVKHGLQIHGKIIRYRFQSNVIVMNALIDMYAKCGNLQKARELFDKMPEADVVSWDIMIAGYAHNGVFHQAFIMFRQMQKASIQPNLSTLSSILNVGVQVSSLKHGVQIHGKIIRHQFQSDAVVMKAVTDMYAKCGSMQKTHELFDKMHDEDVISWNAMITGYAQNDVFHNFLIDMYDKCGSVVDACKVFNLMTQPDVFSWNIIISAHRRHGFPQQALALFSKMHSRAIQPDHFTITAILPVCAELASVKHGLQIHGKIIRCGLQSNVIVMNTLMDMYAKCGNMHKARELFDKMLEADVVSWDTMIAGYAHNGVFYQAFTLFCQMQKTSVQPNHFTLSIILSVSAQVASLKHGVQIHGKIVRHGFQFDTIVTSALIDMYAKCGRMQKAHELFDKMHNPDVVSWNAMITGYAQNGVLDEALRLFNEMPQRSVVSWNAIIAGCAQNELVGKAMMVFEEMQMVGIKPNSTTYATILPLCAKMGALQQGIEIHQKIIEHGFLLDVVVVTMLIDMYAKCGRIQKACKLFDKMHNINEVTGNVMITGYVQNGIIHEALRIFEEMPHHDVASWTALISGYAQKMINGKALEIFKKMQLADVMPGSSTFTSILQVCTRLGDLKNGMEIHQKIIESNYLSDVVAVTALIEMYAKCGSMQKAYRLFDKIPQRDVASWNAIIYVHAQNGLMEQALEFFKQMQLESVEPNSATFASVISACAKMGALQQGKEVHRKIIECGFLSNIIIVNSLINMYENLAP
ncbi:pentatricopeptide repeat-containing protein At2g13600 [Cryptomeria japonica]|uniref:pentatricopeptide repeat-containing protein At2g13600 n=1 Tax=Cryptomeria japonica TaxID=3369 RepID=UPI0027D9F831|nr:pentatricopeptide repeat-containing protein At2g13600 [Cryptomeria japonica]XP_057865968.2 pentatricopeptide repeat-containing protein At2g13600 [Cryptomeria japonica]